MADRQQILYIASRARQLGLDPAAVLAIASHEGLSGGVGDHGTSFGPFQLHQGGALPTNIPLSKAQSWAWSPAGLDYALGRIASVAKGLQGRAAIEAISRQFERPANPDAEISDALSHYGEFAHLSAGSSNGRMLGSGPSDGGSSPSPATIDAGGSESRQRLAQLLLSGVGGRVDFGSNQITPPNLIALAQARMLASGETAPAVGASGKPTRSTAAVLPAKAGTPVADLTSIGGEHATMGLDGFPAKDYFAPSGSPAVAPVTGKVIRLSGHDPKEGPVDGPHGPLGWSVYIQGNDGHVYYLTHMGSRNVRVGETVKAGQKIGTVADYARYGTPSHIHMGVH